MPPRPVALVITDLNVGGAERCLVELAIRLDRRHFLPAVYCLDAHPTPSGEALAGGSPAGDMLARQLEACEIPTYYLGARRRWNFPWALARLRRLLRAQNPCLLQSFLFHANILGRFAAWGPARMAVVAGVRVAERASRWHLALDRRTHKLVDRYVCVSRSVAQFSQDIGRLPAAKIRVIPNGIDVGRYRDIPRADLTAWGLPPARQAITFVGRLHPQKGLDWLLRTAPIWLEKVPGCDLLLVGAGPARDQLYHQARQAGIAGRVHFAGWQSNIPAILAASRLLVLPSRWEGMPNVVLEAMASRLPVLVSDVEGVRELLGPGAEAQTVSFGDDDAWTRKLLALLKDRLLGVRLAEENRRRVEQQFSVASMVTAYESLWTELLDQSP